MSTSGAGRFPDKYLIVHWQSSLYKHIVTIDTGKVPHGASATVKHGPYRRRVIVSEVYNVWTLTPYPVYIDLITVISPTGGIK